MRISTVVDTVEIVVTPSYRHLLKVQSKLANDPELAGKGVPTRITYKTAASDQTTVGILHICCLQRNSDTNYYYSAIFHGQLVDGYFDPSPGGTGDMQDY